MDVAQRLVDAGFKVWIVTGSNPHYVAAVLEVVQQDCSFKKDRKYELNISSTPYSPEKDRIVGNMAKLLENGTFSMVYDDSFTRKGGDGKLLIIEKDGKRIALQHYIEPKENAKAIFCAGNSGGDFHIMRHVLSDERSFGLFVNPRGGLEELALEFAERAVKIFFQEK